MITKAKLFAEEIRRKWFLDRSCDDNVLLFYTWHTNKLYISLGSKAEEVISDIELARLYRTGKGIFVKKPTPDLGDEDETQPKEESNITTTYLGMDALVRQTHAGIMNGYSMTSRMVFSITIPILLVLTIILMCLISNCCCPKTFYMILLPINRQ
ncbi:uncharacterized protein [Amphiura filiformis]|uniref:uncharacterized protein n=1 Tax=Amphiura filiformis TaxID=82378 RepID=UPI003B20B762